jgi:hypothetical protein
VESMATPTTKTPQTAMIPSNHKSEGGNVGEIQSLTLRINDLSRSIDFWNELMLWGLALAAIAAVFVVIATRIVVSQSGKLSDAQGELVAAKDRQLALDLKSKDGKIEEARLATAGISTQLEHERQKTARLQMDAAKLEKQTLDLSAQLQIAGSRAALLMDRSNQKLFERLSAFKGQKVQIKVCSFEDLEMRFAATTLAGLITAQHWTVSLSKGPSPCSIGMGVYVRYDASESVRNAAIELGNLLMDLKLMRSGPTKVVVSPKPIEGAIVYIEPPSADTILLLVYTHP